MCGFPYFMGIINKLPLKPCRDRGCHQCLSRIGAIGRIGARVVFAPFNDWMQIFRSRSYEEMKGIFMDDFTNPAVRAGHGTIGLEIVEQLPDVEAVIIPYGGGGLSCGIAPGVRALKPNTKLFACEVDTAAP